MQNRDYRCGTQPGRGLAWAVLALVGSAVCVPADAAIVQITQSGNQVSTAGISLDADLTGDGADDIAITAVGATYIPGASNLFDLSATIDGQGYQSVGGTIVTTNTVTVTGGASNTQPEGTSAALFHYLPITFTDSNYGVAGEDGIVEVFLQADDTMPALTRIEIIRLVFDPDARGTPGFNQNQSYPEAIPVPEPTAALAVLLPILIRHRRR